MKRELLLSGLEGSNPLGFLAALGVVVALADQGRGTRLSWRDEGAWVALLHPADLDRDELVSRLDADRVGCADDGALGMTYEDGVRDLKPPPADFHAYLEKLASEFEPKTGIARPPSWRSVDWIASFATDVALDNNGRIKPTALHFTAGQQKFLEMAVTLQQQATPAHLGEALFGPWRYESELPVLGWDATACRDYALRASDPSKDKKRGVPGADWLALRGLAMLPVFPARSGPPLTTGCRGGWKTGTFTWPLWSVPLERAVIRTVLSLAGLDAWSPAERAARGIATVFRCGIRRADQGGYGSFSPAAVI